ncbi:hypothetical protein [Methylocucumis oryzae]|uniref:Uncharacterized protein n=1 Tax=Methylocucumis oryzae TaxID=1632867 RepID=A0A0F3IQW9_9GAMM|nr:hypothetical protein [Methylocucumis oryzae]KJV08004.1 hypothetical protein VZ94_00875 [Methylocucumis oryzae]
MQPKQSKTLLHYYPKLNKLTGKDKKHASAEWTRKKLELTEPGESNPQATAPITQQEKTNNKINSTNNPIIDEINAATSIDSLNAVLTQLDIDEYDKYVAYIDDARARLGG